MKGVNTWSFKPYRPALGENCPIHISRLSPGKGSVSLSWISERGCEGSGKVFCRKRGESGGGSEYIASQNTAEITGLEDGCEYEIYVSHSGKNSAVRLFETGYVPGTVVNYLHPEDKAYAFSGSSLCSPSLLKLDDGSLLASMDIFEGDAPQNLSLIFLSTDGGKSWEYLTDLFPCFWGKLFLHEGAVYMLSMSREYGDILIGRSDDGGRNFSMPTVIARGSCLHKSAGWHKAPMPVTRHGGRLWTGVDYGSWTIGGHASCLLSIEEGHDLLEAGNWSITEPLPYDGAWRGAAQGNSAGCLEGNAAVSPDGEILNVLRYQTNGCAPSYGRAAILKGDANDPEKRLEFCEIIDFEGNLSKFDILYDEISRRYVSLVTGTKEHQGRNVLSLAVSEDLYCWRTVCPILDYSHLDPGKVGFQYISFVIDGDDILYLSRTAFNGARNFHDANYSTFHKIENFRSYIDS